MDSSNIMMALSYSSILQISIMSLTGLKSVLARLCFWRLCGRICLFNFSSVKLPAFLSSQFPPSAAKTSGTASLRPCFYHQTSFSGSTLLPPSSIFRDPCNYIEPMDNPDNVLILRSTD